MSFRVESDCIPVEQAILKDSLLNFMNSFGNQFPICISCNNELEVETSSTFESPISRRILKDICIESIFPYYKSLNHDYSTTSFPFCQECTALVSNLTDLYRQFKVIEEEFNKARGTVARGVIRAYLDLHNEACHEYDESEVFRWWQKSMGICNISSEPSNLKDAIEMSEKGEDSTKALNLFETLQNEIELLEIKKELEDDNPLEFYEPEADGLVLPDPMSQFDNIMFQPVIKLERLTDESECKKSTSRDHESDESSNYNIDQNDSNSDDSDEYISNKSVDDEDNRPAEDEYVPPYKLYVSKQGITTRTRAKGLGMRKSRTVTSSDDESDTRQDEASTDSEPKQIFVPRTKRKYTRRNGGNNANKKRIALQKKENSPIDEGTNPKNEDKCGANDTPIKKPKKKRIRKPEPSVECSICKKIISKKYNLVLHMRTHTGEKPFKCSYCEMSFYKTSNLSAHLSKHRDERPHACDLCDARFAVQSALRRHKATQHDIFEADFVFECEFCLKVILSPGAFTDHVRKFHSKDTNNITMNVRCSFCEINFETVDELTKHKSTESHIVEKLKVPKQREPRKNKMDEAKTSKTNELKPKRTEKPKNDGSTRKKILKDGPPRTRIMRERLCPECGVTLPDRRSFLSHQKKFHPKKEFQCEICGNSYSEKGNLKRHIESHSKEKSLMCNFCGEGFKYEISLKYHLTKHTGEGLYKCEYCPSGFNKAKAHRKHLNEAHAEIHLKDKSFICRCCYMNFESEKKLSEHMDDHNHLKCEFCGKYFGVKFKLIKHLRIHTGEKPHKCSFCGKTFTQESNLKEHEHRHTGTRPHRCSFCNTGFLRRKEMQNHIEKNHPEDAVSKTGPSQQLINELDRSEELSSFTNL